MELISAKANPQSLMKSQEIVSGRGRESEEKIRSEFGEVFRNQSEKSADTNPVEESVPAQSPPIGREPESEELNSKRFQQKGANANSSMTEREKAILKFMDSFESEFGVPPQRMVAAMAGLDQQEILLPPEQTADLVIEKLHLHDDEKEKAQAVYVGFLLQLSGMRSLSNKIDMQNQMQGDSKPSKTGDLLSMNEAIQQRAATAAAAAAMAAAYASDTATVKDVAMDTQSGFREVDSVSPATSEEAVLGKDAFFDGPSLVGGSSVGESFTKDPTLAISRQLQGEVNVVGKKIDAKILDAKIVDAKVEGNSTAEDRSLETRDLSPALIAASQLQGTDSETNQNFSQQQQSSERQESQSSQTGQVTQEDQQFLKSSSKTRLQSEGLGQKKVKVDELNFRQMAESLSGDRVGVQGQNDLGKNFSKLAPLPGGGSELGLARSGSFDHEANIKEIMSQAQVLIKNGGGEMKVKMTPEGLGELQMKVSVVDGKVSVQMMTESREAKAAIESSLADLKTSLSAQKLSVEHMKVDVVGSSSESAKLGFGTNGGSHSEPRPESGPDSNQNFQRDSTRQFWNQFQQNFGNRSQREGLFDVMPKGYASRKPYEPLEAPTISAQRASLARGKGSELNLVA